MKGVEILTKKEQTANIVEIYTNLLRIKNAQDKDAEIENQLSIAKAKLQALGVVVEDLVIR